MPKIYAIRVTSSAQISRSEVYSITTPDFKVPFRMEVVSQIDVPRHPDG
jgi:hypothetical protein